MKKIKIFLFSSIFLIASLVAVGFYIFSPSISYAVTATGSFSNPSCIIADFESSCEPTFSYATSNATNPLVSTPGELELSTAESNDITDTHSLEMGSSREYFLYNNGITGVLMDRMTIYPTCASGNWSVNHCLPSESSFSNYGSLSASSCDVPELGISCLATISWGITSVNDIGENVRIYINGKNLLKTISTSSSVKSGSFTATVPYGTNIFYLEGANGMIKKATGQAICSNDTVWDNTKCLNVNDWNDMVIDHFTVNRCSIPKGAETCDVAISWKINPFSGNDTATVKVSVNGSVSTAFEGNSGSNRVYTVGKNIVEFSLYYRDAPLVSVSGSPTYGEFNSNTNINCVIEPMHSTCIPHLLWGVSNSVYLPKVTATINGVLNIQIATGTSGVFDDSSHTLNPSQSREYFLYHDNTPLDSVMIDSNCASGTHWNGSFCSPGYVEIGTTCSDIVKFPDNPEYCIPTNTSLTCEIPVNGSSCDVYTGFSWTTTNPQMPLPVIQSQANVQFSLVARGGETLIGGTGYQNLVDAWGAWIIHIKHNMYGPQSQIFDATYDTKLLDSQTATSHCASGSVWDGTKCSPATFSATDCVIAPNQSTCLSTFDFKLTVNPNFSTVPSDGGFCYWYTRDVTSIKTSNGTVVYSNPPYGYCETSSSYGFDQENKNGLAAIGYSESLDQSRTPQRIVSFEKTLSQSINYGENSLSLYNNFGNVTDASSDAFYTVRGTVKMVSVTPTATCTYGYTWDGNKCSIPEGTFTVTPCEIQEGDSSCEASFAWNVQNRAPSGSASLTIFSPLVPPIQLSGEFGSHSFTFYSRLDSNPNSFITVSLIYDGVPLVPLVAYRIPNYKYYANCVANTEWNFDGGGQKCISNIVPAQGWITSTNCVISAGQSTCPSKIAWSLSKSIPGASTKVTAIIDGTPNTQIGTGNSNTTGLNYSIKEGSTIFYLYHNDTEPPLKTSTATATCTKNSTHNGTICDCNIGTVFDTGQCLTEVNLKVYKKINNEIINVPLLTKIARAIGIFSKKDTIEAVPSSTKIQVDWIANGFDNSNIVCTMPDGSRKNKGDYYGTYIPSTPPTSNTQYQITCTDTVDTPTPPTPPNTTTPSFSNIYISNVQTNPPVDAYTPTPTISGTHYYHNGDDVNHVALEFNAVNANSCTLNNVNPSSVAVGGVLPAFSKTGDYQYYWSGNENMQIPPQVTIRCTNSTSGLSSSLTYYFNVCSDIDEDFCSLF